MRLYWNYFLMQLKSQMQHKMSLFLSVAGQFLTAFTTFFGINFIFEKVNRVDDFSYEQVLLCFAVTMLSFSIGEMFGGGFGVFSRLIRDGSFDRILMRPRSIVMQIIIPNMDFARIGMLIQAAIVLCIAVPVSGINWNWIKVLILCLMILCGSIVFFCLFLVNATFSFFTIEAMDFLNIFTYGAREFGKYPFSIYGDGVLRILTYIIPLALFQYYPMLYLFDRGQSIWLILSPLFSLLFVIPAYGFFRFGLSKYKSVGS